MSPGNRAINHMAAVAIDACHTIVNGDEVKPEWTPERIFGGAPQHDMRSREEHLATIQDEFGRSLAERMHKVSDAIMATRMPPLGVLRLPELLDRRRMEWCIPHTAFRLQAVYDRLYIFQIPSNKSETFIEGGKIFVPQSTKKGRDQQASRGIIISAGLIALDRLASHGMAVGDITQFTRLSPFRQWFDNIEGQDQFLLALHGGDPISDEDLRRKLWDGTLTCEQVPDERGGMQHVYKDKHGNFVRPLPTDSLGEY